VKLVCRTVRLLSYLLVGGVLLSLPGLAATPEEIFDRGNDAYLNGDFDEAASAYRTVIEYGIIDPRVEYNLANTEFKLGRLGHALLHYEIARRLDPADEEIAANLQYARSFTIDLVEHEEPIAPLRIYRQFQDRMGPDIQAWAALILVWLITALVAWACSQPGRWRALHAWLLSGLLLLLLLTSASWYGTLNRLTGTKLAVVLDDVVEVLAGPADNNATLFTVHEGLTVGLRDGRSGEWIQISHPNGLNGWLPASSVGLVE
jgi:tetratricopeptide (TPR) repeat protein